MAIDARILLAVRAPDVGQTFSNALLNVQRFQGIEQTRASDPLRNRLLEAQTDSNEVVQRHAEPTTTIQPSR